jgi:hypothetical protein
MQVMSRVERRQTAVAGKTIYHVIASISHCSPSIMPQQSNYSPPEKAPTCSRHRQSENATSDFATALRDPYHHSFLVRFS